jgi:hypothetical protein
LTVRIKGAACPRCGTVSDAATHHEKMYEPVLPKPDDLVVCAYCGAALRFDRSLKMVALTATELVQLSVIDPDTYQLLTRMRQAVRGPDSPFNR